MKRGFLLIPLLAAATLLAAVASPTWERKLGKVQKIKRWGYRLRVPDRWVSIPQKPGQTRVVGSWKPDMDQIEKRWDMASLGCELIIVRFPIKGTVTESSSKKDKDKPKKKKRRSRSRILRRFAGVSSAKTMEDYIEARFKGAKRRYVPKRIAAGKGSKKLSGTLMEFTSGRSFVCAAVFPKGKYDWGVFYLAPEDWYVKEWKKLYLKSIKSFRLFDPEGEPLTVAPGFDKSKLSSDDKRQQIKAGIAGNPGWWAHDTKNYVFLSNSKKKSFIRGLAKEIEVIRKKVYEKYFPPTNKVVAICIVRVFSDQSEYHQYGGPGGSAGYWDSSREELVLFDNFQDVSKVKSKRFTKSVMYHEAFHQYIHYAVGDMAPHSWFNEGHGDFFAGMLVRGSKVVVKPFDWRVRFLKRHLSQKKGLIPTRSLVRLPQREYYNNAGLKYSQGWALIYFLRHVTKNKWWRGAPDRYYEHLRDNLAAFKKSKEDKDDTGGESIPGIPGVKIYSFEDTEKVEKILEDAVDKGFEGINYEKLDVAFRRWVDSLRG